MSCHTMFSPLCLSYQPVTIHVCILIKTSFTPCMWGLTSYENEFLYEYKATSYFRYTFPFASLIVKLNFYMNMKQLVISHFQYTLLFFFLFFLFIYFFCFFNNLVDTFSAHRLWQFLTLHTQKHMDFDV